MTEVARGPGWELRLGDYREVLADVTCDALITDGDSVFYVAP